MREFSQYTLTGADKRRMYVVRWMG